MQHAFQAISTSALSLFGLVLASLSFGFGAAMRQLQDPGNFRRFSAWLWTAGTCCCIYYSYCFLTTTHMLYRPYSDSFLLLMLCLATVLLGAGHVLESVFLYRLGHADRPNFKWIFRTQTSLAALTFLLFLFLNWRVLAFPTVKLRQDNLFFALIFTLIIVSFRAVFLVGFSFYSVVVLQAARKRARVSTASQMVDATGRTPAGSHAGSDKR